VKRAKEEYERSAKIPADMAKKAAELQSEGYQTWVKARTAKDFNAFSPILKEWVDLVKARCELIKPGEDAFNTSLDEYERGMTAERLDEIFPVVKTCVVDLIKRVYDLLVLVTGKPLDAEAFTTYLTEKYTKLYDL